MKPHRQRFHHSGFRSSTGWLAHWAAGRLCVYLVDRLPRERDRLCRLLRAARLDCHPCRSEQAALAHLGRRAGEPVPAILITDLRGERQPLHGARQQRSDLVVIGLSSLVRTTTGCQFSPLRGVLGVDYLLPHPVEPAELLATLVLAAGERPDAAGLAQAS